MAGPRGSKRTQIWSRFQELGREGESDGSEVGHADEPTTAMSASYFSGWCRGRARRTTYFLKMPSSVLNLELSSTGFSTAAFGVAALDASLELSAEAVVEPGRAFSAGRSAMAFCACFSGGVEEKKESMDVSQDYDDPKR
jgi:hypothetical protein